MENSEPELTPPTSKKGFVLKSEMIVALSAVFVSVATLFVYIYQAKIMQGQQHAAVWPHLEWRYGFRSDDGFTLTVVNKGVGPAIVKSSKMTYDGLEVKDSRELLSKFVNLDSVGFFYSSVNNMVIAPNEKIEVVHLYVKDNKEYQKLQMEMEDFYSKLTYEICFCSIYNDCWLYKGKGQEMEECK
jgi:hypothetical protein